MMNKRDFFKANKYGLLRNAATILCLAAFVYGLTEEGLSRTLTLIVAAFLLGVACLIQWKGDHAFSTYQDAVNRRTDDDLT